MVEGAVRLAVGHSRADHNREPATVARIVAIANDVLVRYGVDVRAARRAYGWSNLTWLAGGLAVRVAAVPEVEDLLREALKGAFGPPGESVRPPNPDGTDRRIVQETVLRSVLPSLRQSGSADRLLGYAVLLEMWGTENELRQWDGESDFRTWSPHRKLTALIDGSGGYLREVLAEIT